MGIKEFCQTQATICGKTGIYETEGLFQPYRSRDLPIQLSFSKYYTRSAHKEIQADIYIGKTDKWILVTWNLEEGNFIVQENLDNGDIIYHNDEEESFRTVCATIRKLVK